MRSKTILGLMSFVMITACGKSMQVTLNNGVKSDAAKTSVLKTAPATGASSASDLSPSAYDGKLGALSEYDLSNVKDGYPFLNAGEVATSNSVRTLGSFAYSVEKDGEQHGFVKSSNLVFRAINQIPPIEAIDEVITLKLRFKGARLNLKSSAEQAGLAKQVICVLDTKQCAGDPASDSSEEIANLNPTFWKNRSVVETPAKPFESITGFKLEHRLEDGSQVFVYTPAKKDAPVFGIATPTMKIAAVSPTSGMAKNPDADSSDDLVIDLKEVFGLKDKEAAKKWIYDNSTEFATGSYRKFQFVIGNNFYAQEGKLVVQTTQTDKMPKDFAVQIGALKNPKDAAQDLKSAAPIVIKEKQSDANPASPVVPALPTTKSQTSKDLKADLFEGDTAKLTVAAESKLKDVAAKIKIDEASIIEVSITGQGDAVELPGERAKAVKSLLEQSGISASILQTYQSPGSELKVNLTINFGNSVRSTRSAEELARAAKDLTDAINQILP